MAERILEKEKSFKNSLDTLPTAEIFSGQFSPKLGWIGQRNDKVTIKKESKSEFLSKIYMG